MVYNPLQENYEAGVMDGKTYGRIDAKKEVCIALLQEGSYNDDKIAALLKMPLEDVLKLKKTIK